MGHQAINLGNGQVVCFRFHPGEHRIEVFYCGKPIRGSPFHANVYDWSKINVVNLPGKGSIRKPVEFESRLFFRSYISYG